MRWKLLFVVALSVFACYLVAPTFIYFSQPVSVRTDPDQLKAKIPNWLPEKMVKLGLDLQGGVQLVLGVETDTAVENRLGRLGTEISRWSSDNNKGVSSAYVLQGEKALRVELEPETDLAKFKKELTDEFGEMDQVGRDGMKIDLAFTDENIKRIKRSSLEQAERVIRSRVDKWGVTEPMINRRADGSVLVQLPGFRDPEKAKELLGRTAQLTFKIVDDDFAGFDQLAAPFPEGIRLERPGAHAVLISSDRDAIRELVKDKVPKDRQVVFERNELAGGKKAEYTTMVVFAAAEVSGEDVLDANLTIDSSALDQKPAVSLKFTGSGGKRFSEVTGANVQKRMAIILDDEVVSAPVIQTKISGGNAQITLGALGYNEALEEAEELSLILKSGALPAKISVLEERQVGATLGPELAQQGILATGLGLVLVIAFMLMYYRRPGLLACLALTLNGLFLLAGMSMFGFALTLPGIAGFILTLGMAVDANVLINERIRQELASGKNAKKAVEVGFDKVFWTIIDANVTTLIAALVLLQTNTSGPIKGFAVTLMLGLLVSMFTSLYCSKLFFSLVVARCSTDAQVRVWLGGSAAEQLRKFNFDFLRYGKAAAAVGIALALAVVGAFTVRGMNWSVDFAGGTEMEVGFSTDVKPESLRDAGKKAGISGLVAQNLEGGFQRYLLRFESTPAASDGADGTAGASAESLEKITKLRETIASDLASYNPDILRVDFVGPQIGRELKTQGALSLFYAVLGIFAYILLRFDMRFGPGAILKMIQDVFVILGFYAFFWRSFDLTSVAALLTVIGYSVNDTIVIYDRIRENLTLHPKRLLPESINVSLNETLSRTINTSVTTIVALIGILVFGTAQIWNFAAAMAIGVVAATLSSMFLASSFVLWLENWRKNKSRGGAVAA